MRPMTMSRRRAFQIFLTSYFYSVLHACRSVQSVSVSVLCCVDEMEINRNDTKSIDFPYKSVQEAERRTKGKTNR